MLFTGLAGINNQAKPSGSRLISLYRKKRGGYWRMDDGVMRMEQNIVSSKIMDGNAHATTGQAAP
jgi:hypothetical protein